MKRAKSRETVRKEVEDMLDKYDIHLDPIDFTFLVEHTLWDVNRSNGTIATTDPVVNRGRKVSREVWDVISERRYEEAEGTIKDVTETNKKSEVEKAAKAFLHKQIIEKCGGICDNPEDYITEFAWVGNCLYASIDQLQNPTLIATLEEGVLI